MPNHAWVALFVVGVAALIDFRTRRIPNRLLLLAAFIHAAIAFRWKQYPEVGINHLLIGTALFFAFLIPRIRYVFSRHIGMGDLKLLLYLSIFFIPSIHITTWLIGFSATASVVLLFRRARLHLSLPLAPIIFAASILSMGQILVITPALHPHVGELVHAMDDIR